MNNACHSGDSGDPVAFDRPSSAINGLLQRHARRRDAYFTSVGADVPGRSVPIRGRHKKKCSAFTAVTGNFLLANVGPDRMVVACGCKSGGARPPRPAACKHGGRVPGSLAMGRRQLLTAIARRRTSCADDQSSEVTDWPWAKPSRHRTRFPSPRHRTDYGRRLLDIALFADLKRHGLESTVSQFSTRGSPLLEV